MSARVDMTQRLYSPAEVAAWLGVSRTTVQELIFWGRRLRGEMHPVKGSLWPVESLGWRTVRVPAAAVERLIEHRARLSASPAAMAAARMRARALGSYGRSGTGQRGRVALAA